jgi:hypothetical protein
MKTENAAKKGPNMFLKLLCTLHNLTQLGGWGYLLFTIVVINMNEQKLTFDVLKYPGVIQNLLVIQSLQWLDLLFGALGVTKTNVAMSFTQIIARFWFVFVVFSVKLDNKYALLPLIPWCFAELIRYSYYMSTDFEFLTLVRPPLKWLRLTGFMVFYPCGGVGEMMCLYEAWDVIARDRPYSLVMPNVLNFELDMLFGARAFCIIMPTGMVFLYKGLLGKYRICFTFNNFIF